MVADGAVGRWIQRGQTFYDQQLDNQPAGQVDLYVSDFLRGRPLPTAFSRPLAAEVAAGVSRSVLLSILGFRLPLY